MTTHRTAANAGIVKAMKKNNQSANKLATAAVRHANKLYKGAGGKVAMMKALARYAVNHPGSKRAKRMVGVLANR